jgi:hypothetical protein
LASFNAGHVAIRQPASAVELEGQAAVPLCAAHLEQVDLWHRAGDVEQCIDPTECGERLIDHGFRRRYLGKVDIR